MTEYTDDDWNDIRVDAGGRHGNDPDFGKDNLSLGEVLFMGVFAAIMFLPAIAWIAGMLR